MSAYIQAQLAHRQEVLNARAVETLATAQAALVKAQAQYQTLPTTAYAIAAAQDRVEAAKARINASFQTLAEWSKTDNGREYMDSRDETPGLMWELRAARMI